MYYELFNNASLQYIPILAEYNNSFQIHCTLDWGGSLSCRREPVDEYSKLCPWHECAHMSVKCILDDQQVHSHYHRKFMQWTWQIFHHMSISMLGFLHNFVNIPKFSHHIFTDEAHFAREIIFNYWNSHVWDNENPHATQSINQSINLLYLNWQS